jgi:hypothetical protein
MVHSGGKLMLKISLVLIFSAALHAGRTNLQSTEDINNPGNITAKYTENIRYNIEKRMLLIIDDLSAVRHQLHPHHVPLKTSREQEQLHGELSRMKLALQNSDFRVNMMQRRDNAKLFSG